MKLVRVFWNTEWPSEAFNQVVAIAARVLSAVNSGKQLTPAQVEVCDVMLSWCLLFAAMCTHVYCLLFTHTPTHKSTQDLLSLRASDSTPVHVGLGWKTRAEVPVQSVKDLYGPLHEAAKTAAAASHSHSGSAAADKDGDEKDKAAAAEEKERLEDPDHTDSRGQLSVADVCCSFWCCVACLCVCVCV